MQTSPLKGEDIAEVRACRGNRQSAGWTCAPWDRNRNVTNSQEKEKNQFRQECHLSPPWQL